MLRRTRRRILGEVAKALRHGSEETGTGTGTAAGASSGPARVFVELVNSLVKTAASKATLDAMHQLLKSKGVATSRLHTVAHEGCEYHGAVLK